MKLLFFATLILLTTLSKSCEPDIEQGIAGELRWFEGNMMPTISENPETDNEERQGEPVQREVHVYELTTMDDVNSRGPLFQNVRTKLVETVETDEQGRFQVELPAGQYSVFVQEEEGLFANSFDGEGNINPVEVQEGEVTVIQIDINYKAAY